MPLLAVAWLRRGLPETQRFEHAKQQRAANSIAFAPLLALARMYPGRMALLLAVLVPFEFVVIVGATFMTKTLQQVHGWSPGGVTALFVVGGALAIIGNIAAGLASDRIGRRTTMALLLALYGLACFGFYNSTAWLVAPLWIAMIFASEGAGVLFKVLGSELFPTSYRSTASAFRGLVGTLAGSFGLWLESQLYPLVGSHAGVISTLLPVLLLPILLGFRLPETATRELEQIAPER